VVIRIVSAAAPAVPSSETTTQMDERKAHRANVEPNAQGRDIEHPANTPHPTIAHRPRTPWNNRTSSTATSTSGTSTTPNCGGRGWRPIVAVHPNLGDISQLKANYKVDDYLNDNRGSKVTKAVHVQAAIGSPDPVQETRWLQAMADRTGFPHGIVAYAKLKEPDVEAELARHCEFANTRGIRDFSEGDYLMDADFRRGFALLEKFDLVCDLDCSWPDMSKARDLAKKYPGITIVLDHAGFPRQRNSEYQASWQRGMDELAEADNVVCKISGLGMGDQMAGGNWTVDSIRPTCWDASTLSACDAASSARIGRLTRCTATTRP